MFARLPRHARRLVAGAVVASAFAGGLGANANAGTDARTADRPATGFVCEDLYLGDGSQPCGPGQQIQFAAGENSWQFEGGIYTDVQVWYFDARAGQAFQFNFQYADPGILAVMYAPDGTALLPADFTEGFADGTLPADGRYTIIVQSDGSGGPYAMSLGIDTPFALTMGIYDRISFAAGTDRLTVGGAIISGTTDRWLFTAKAGQDATVDLTSLEANAVFDLYDPMGELLSGPEPVTTWTGPLPLDGTYHLVLSSTARNATYDLSLVIPGGTADSVGDMAPRRLTFAPGTDWGEIWGWLPAGGVDSWVFNAAAGQQATIESYGDPVTVEVYTADGQPLLMAGSSNSQAIADLPVDGDYYLFVAAPTDADADYDLIVTIPDDVPGPEPLPDPDPVTEPAPDTGLGDVYEIVRRGEIAFASGTSFGEVSGYTDDFIGESWTLSAGAGQDLSFSVGAADGNAVATFYDPSGNVIASGSYGYAVLPADGNYLVEVTSTGGGADYFLYVEIT